MTVSFTSKLSQIFAESDMRSVVAAITSITSVGAALGLVRPNGTRTGRTDSVVRDRLYTIDAVLVRILIMTLRLLALVGVLVGQTFCQMPCSRIESTAQVWTFDQAHGLDLKSITLNDDMVWLGCTGPRRDPPGELEPDHEGCNNFFCTTGSNFFRFWNYRCRCCASCQVQRWATPDHSCRSYQLRVHQSGHPRDGI